LLAAAVVLVIMRELTKEMVVLVVAILVVMDYLLVLPLEMIIHILVLAVRNPLVEQQKIIAHSLQVLLDRALAQITETFGVALVAVVVSMEVVLLLIMLAPAVVAVILILLY
jgi:hypothetical protein